MREGVLGVRYHGEIGARRFGFDAPGRASPAFSCCSNQGQKIEGAESEIHTFVPTKNRSDDLKHLELPRVGSLQTDEMEKVVGNELPSSVSQS